MFKVKHPSFIPTVMVGLSLSLSHQTCLELAIWCLDDSKKFHIEEVAQESVDITERYTLNMIINVTYSSCLAQY